MMPLQRACGAESQVRNKLSNGPLRVQSNVKLLFHKVFCNVRAYVSCRGYDGIPPSAQGIPVNPGWHRGFYTFVRFVPDRWYFIYLSGTFLFESPSRRRGGVHARMHSRIDIGQARHMSRKGKARTANVSAIAEC